MTYLLICLIGFKSSATSKLQPVAAVSFSTVSPSAISINLKPLSKSTVNTAFSVIIMLTHCFPVRGKLHCFKIFGLPFFALCSIQITTLVPGADTKSIAPPIPFTSLPLNNHHNIIIRISYYGIDTYRYHPVGQVAILRYFHCT